MNAIVRVSKSFKRQAKPLLKKFPSLYQELNHLKNKLEENPGLGTPIGQDSYKIRLAVKSKGKGKLGGLRAISHLDTEIVGIVDGENENKVVILMSIYDKSKTASISNKELRDLIAGLHLE